MSIEARVLLANVKMMAKGGFYRQGTKAHQRCQEGTRRLAACIIAVGCSA